MSNKVIMFSGRVCPLCKRMVPIFQKVQMEYGEEVEFEEMETLSSIPFLQSHHLEISTLPSFVFFHDGRVFSILTGVISFDKFCETIDEMLG